MSDTQSLEKLIAVGDTLTLSSGKIITIKPLTISKLPAAVALCKRLFEDQSINLANADFMLELTHENIDDIKALLMLSTNLISEELELSIVEFMQLFGVFLNVNADFFFKTLTKKAVKQIG